MGEAKFLLSTAYFEATPRLAVRLGGVPHQFPFESTQVANEF